MCGSPQEEGPWSWPEETNMSQAQERWREEARILRAQGPEKELRGHETHGCLGQMLSSACQMPSPLPIGLPPQPTANGLLPGIFKTQSLERQGACPCQNSAKAGHPPGTLWYCQPGARMATTMGANLHRAHVPVTDPPALAPRSLPKAEGTAGVTG